MPAPTPFSSADLKAERRSAVLAARRAVPDPVHDDEARRLGAHLPDAVRGARTVCAYLPVGSEPGSPELLQPLQPAA